MFTILTAGSYFFPAGDFRAVEVETDDQGGEIAH